MQLRLSNQFQGSRKYSTIFECLFNLIHILLFALVKNNTIHLFYITQILAVTCRKEGELGR